MQRIGVAVIAAATIGIVITALVSGLYVASQSIFSSGIILGAHAPFTVTGLSGVYTGRNNITGQTTSGSSATTVISTVFGWMSTGQSVEFIGTFNWAGQVNLAKSITMDFTQATITFTTASPLVISRQVTMLGGHTVHIYAPAQDHDPPNNGGHFIGNSGCNIYFTETPSNSLIDGLDLKNFGFFFIYPSTFTNMKFQNCIFHDRTYGSGGNEECISGSGGGYHTVQDCRFLDIQGQAIFLEGSNSHCNFLRCEFARVGTAGPGHSIYLSGGSASVPAVGGNNTIADCISHDHGSYGGSIHVKGPHNKIYGNTFYNGPDTVAISVYSQWASSQANDNEIYNNTFTDMMSGIWIGKNDAVEPTLRNKIYSNTFTRVTYCIQLLLSGATSPVDDTKIYYNDFHSCPNPFTSGVPSLVHNTVVAYNYFDANVSPTLLQSLVNSMSYQNTFFPPNTALATPNFNYSLILDPNSYYYVAPRD